MVLKLAQVGCAAWLAFQFLLPLVPTWGAFIPHEHWARQSITAAEMNAHWDEHRAGNANATRATSRSTNAKIISTYEQNVLSSFTAPLADVAQNVFCVTPTLHAIAKFRVGGFFARAMNNPPLVPPPNQV